MVLARQPDGRRRAATSQKAQCLAVQSAKLTQMLVRARSKAAIVCKGGGASFRRRGPP